MKLYKIAFYITLLFLGLVVFAGIKREQFPETKEILSELEQEPEQILVSEPAYEFAYKGSEYVVEPVADYELWGLVVSQNNINAFADIYHDENSVDIKDLCVVWGVNTKQEVLKTFEFYSEPWTCNFRTDNRENLSNFSLYKISNSHLLSRSESTRNQLTNVHIGDQIYISGQLVNYSPKSQPDWVRNTSITREDTGNGACEVVMVDNFRILKKGNAQWHELYSLFRSGAWILVILTTLLFLKDCYRF